jgi:hypothetical protein
MPEAVRVVSFIEAPHGSRRRWTDRLVELALEPLDGGRADREVFTILYIPGNALWAQVRPLRNDRFCALNGLRCQTAGRSGRWCACRETHHAVALAHALNGPRTWGIWPQLLAYLVRTQGRMALAEGHHPRLSGRVETTVWSLRPSTMVRKGLTHRRQRMVPELIEVTARDPKRDRDVGGLLASEQGHDRLQATVLFRTHTV